MKTLLIDRWENSFLKKIKVKVSRQIYRDHLGLIGFVIVTQYFISCDLGFKTQ